MAESMDLFLSSAARSMPPMLSRSRSNTSDVSLGESQADLGEYLGSINGQLKTQYTKLNKSLSAFHSEVQRDTANFNSLRRETLVPNQSKTLDALIGSGYDKYSRGLSGGFSKKQLTKIILDKNKVIGDLEETAYSGSGLSGGFSKKQLTKIILDKNKVIGDLEETAYKGGRLRGYGYTHAENNFAYSHGISKYI